MKSALPGADKTISADDGGKRARSPGRARHKPLKPLRRECRVFRGTCGEYSCAFYQCTRGCGCSGHPAFPAPSIGRKIHAMTRAHRAAGPRTRIWIPRHCEPTGRANARPMTGSAKQSIFLFAATMDCFAPLAMTTLQTELSLSCLKIESSYVVPAKAGTHNHRRSLGQKVSDCAPQNDRARRMGPRVRGDDEVE